MDVRSKLNELKQTWKAPAELDRGRPREVRLTGAGRALLGLAFALLAAGLTAGVLLYVKASSDRDLRLQREEEGPIAPARVTRSWISGGKEKKYHIEYEYWAEGRTYAGSMTVGRQSSHRLPVGSTLPIHYLPRDPYLHYVPGYDRGPMPIFLPFIIGPALALLAWVAHHTLNSQRHLLAEGRAAAALVTRIEKTQHGKVAHYSFLDLSGTLAAGKTGPSSNPPSEGSVLCVVYEPDRLKNNALYPFRLVREEHASDHQVPADSRRAIALLARRSLFRRR